MRLSALVAFGISLAGASIASASPSGKVPDRLAVHEWGTFTVLQDEAGKPIGGINTDDEPVPNFVHTLHAMLLQHDSEVPPIYFKGWPRCDRDVYVRLETPVIYFHLPAGSAPVKLDVDVSFNGGWLTQFYPDAKASAPGIQDDKFEFGKITEKTVGTLSWHDLTVGGTPRPAPPTTDKVWLAPRQVDAADVTTPAGESERFLFYRGVGHLRAPMTASRDASGKNLLIRPDWGDLARQTPTPAVGPLWLLDVRDDGTSAMRAIDPAAFHGEAEKAQAEIPATFSPSEYSKDTLAAMRKELHGALMHDGLYSDEADSLLNTWEVSYFRRPGLRLFFMVPPVWTQHMLPLKVSQSAYVSRAMVGRIEIVTPEQRALLKRIGRGPASKPDWVQNAFLKAGGGREDYYREDWYKKVMAGKLSMLDVKAPMPDDYRAYLGLGRFRNALILDEGERAPTPALTQFIANYQLGAYKTR
ncbi:MAG: hypothetical protein JWP03_1077 [Phycisphaerales bacterium]|jgi:hypothetical protein|nr:hypothetical protein [Phycisphaerales bacterium]